VGVIVREEYVCDYCSKPITDGDMLIGRLTLRKQGARGLGREVVLTLHPPCSSKLTANASGTARGRRVRAATVEEEPAAPPETKPSPRRRRKSSAPTEAQ
jgi:hypothetical protein